MTSEYRLNFDDFKVVLKEIIINFKESHLQKLHRIDEGLLEKGIIDNNLEAIELSLITYSLRKLLSKKHITSNEQWPKIKINILDVLNNALELYKKKDIINYNSKIKDIETIIKNADFALGNFVLNLVQNSRNKLASSVYGYGLSLSKSCNLLHANKDQVMAIIGKTKISDEDEKIKSIKERVNYLCNKDLIKDDDL